MKVISKLNTYRVRCESCGSLLEFDDDDVYKDESTQVNYVDCPVCKCVVNVDDVYEDGDDLTIRNIIFPDDFTHGAIDTNSTEAREVTEQIRDMLCNLEEQDFCEHCDLAVIDYKEMNKYFIFAIKREEEYEVFVAPKAVTALVWRNDDDE